MAIFRTFFLGNIVQENVFYDILERTTQEMYVVVQIYPWFYSLSYMSSDTQQQRKTEFTVKPSQAYPSRLH